MDGERVPLYRVNGSFMGVPVPAGAHEVRLQFWPVRIVFLIGLNVLVLLLLLGYCAAHVIARLWKERLMLKTQIFLDKPFVAKQRRELIAYARGDVLEIGFGTGLNLPQILSLRVNQNCWPSRV